MLRKEQVVSIRAIDAPNLVDVAKTFGDEQSGICSIPFQQRVDGDRRSVQKQVCVGRFYACTVHRVLNAIDQRAVRGQRLSKHQSALSFVESSQIGECATDIYCDPKTAFGPRLFSGCHNSHPCRTEYFL